MYNMVQTLLEHGADVHAWDNYGSTSLHRFGQGEPKAVQLLIHHHVDINSLDDTNSTPNITSVLHLAISPRKYLDTVELLIPKVW